MFLLLFIVYTNPYAEINQFLDSWHQAAAEARELDYFAKLAEDAVFLGTDATERWSKLEFQKYAHPYFAQGKAWLFKATRRAVILSSDRNLAWFDEDLETEKMGKCRGSGVLKRVNSEWKIVHYNLSLTIPNEKMGLVQKVLGK